MSATLRKKRAARKKRSFQDGRRRIKKRLANTPGPERPVPMMTATNIHYEPAGRVRGLAAGGIGAIFLLAQKIELDKEIDRTLHLLKQHRPYHESDHVLNIAFNILAGGKRLEHLELRRNDEVYLDALGAQRIPDPTTAGDFCRRFASEADVLTLMDAINESRLRVWAQQPDAFLDEAILDADSTIVETDAECKEGVDITYDGRWGYHPLLDLAGQYGRTPVPAQSQRQSPVAGAGRRVPGQGDRAVHPGRLPQDPAAGRHADRRERGPGSLGRSAAAAGRHDDRRDRGPGLPGTMRGTSASSSAMRPTTASRPGPTSCRRRRTASWNDRRGTRSRRRPASDPNGSRRRSSASAASRRSICSRRWSAEFDYRPTACQKSYRMIVLRKRLGTDQGQMRLFEEYRYFFYITNDREMSAEEVVFSANDRCDQENLVAQLKSGVHALTTPVDNLVSNWAYMVMASLAWSLKAWSALLVPVSPRHEAKHQAEKRTLLRMEFATYCAAFIQMPCQIVRGGRRLIYRMLSWNPWQGVFLRLVERLHECWQC